MRHQYLVTEPLDPAVAAEVDHRPRPRPHRLLPPRGGRPARRRLLARSRHLGRRPAARGAADALRRPTWSASPSPGRERRSACPRCATPRSRRSSTGPRRSRPTASSSSARPEVTGLWVAAGFCVHGLAGAGGVGRVIAEWIVKGQPWVDVSAMDIRRFGRHWRSRPLRPRPRARGLLAATTTSSTPARSSEAGRPLRIPPAYEPLQRARRELRREGRLGAGQLVRVRTPPPATSRCARDGWPGRNWSPAIGAECVATRDAAGLFDQSSFAKLDVAGPGATQALAPDLRQRHRQAEPGPAVYTQLLNDRGGIEADLTVTRVAEESFRVVTGTAFGTHDLAWIRRHLPTTARSASRTSPRARACFCLWGPRAREILEPLTDADLSQRGPPVPPRPADRRRRRPGARPADHVRRRARLGALHARRVRADALGPALGGGRRRTGCVGGGYRAIDSMRLEKGYRVWGLDITPETTPYEAGLGFAVAARQARRLHRPRRAARAGEGGGPPSAACAASSSTSRARSPSATSPSASTATPPAA